MLTYTWKPSQAPTQGNFQAWRKFLSSCFHSSTLFGKWTYLSYNVVNKTLQTSLKITAAVDSATPNKSPTRKQARWPHFFYCIFLMFITWMFSTPSFKKSLIVEKFQGNYLKSKIIPVAISRCPPRAISWLILASLFPFIRTQQNITSSKDLCFFHLLFHLTQRHLILGSWSFCCP